jgi:hypothetical protein
MRTLWALWLALLLLALAGCGTPVHVPLDGPGLRRAVAQGGQSALHFWWLPPTAQNPAARLLLWDGVNVGISDPAASDQNFTPLKSEIRCDQVALAPDNRAFACGLMGIASGGVLVQPLDSPAASAQSLLDESAPLAWASDSRWLAALRLGNINAVKACSVVVVDTSLPDQSEATEQVLLDNIPFAAVGDKGESICPVTALAWSPDGTRLALSLATPDGVVLEVLHMDAPGQPAIIESRHLLPGKPLQILDAPGVSSLFWSSDGQTLAALTGYGTSSEDGLYIFSFGQQPTQSAPNLIDTGDGAALAFAPDGRWLAVGAVGPRKGSDNAQLRILDTTNGHWHNLATMFVNGPTLAWSADGALLAAASVAQQGEVIWHWPAASLDSIIPNRESANIEQLGWAQDGSALLFTLGARSGSAPFPDEVYAQRFPVPPGVSSFAFPVWFLDVLALLPQALIWFGGALLVVIALAAALVLIERGRSRRRRAFITWTLGICAVLFGLLLASYTSLPGWMAALYQPYSARICRGAPDPCNLGAALAVGTIAGPLVLALLVLAAGVLFAGRRRELAPGEGLPWPVSRGPFTEDAPFAPAEEEALLLLPAPIDEQDTLELEVPAEVLQSAHDEAGEPD